MSSTPIDFPLDRSELDQSINTGNFAPGTALLDGDVFISGGTSYNWRLDSGETYGRWRNEDPGATGDGRYVQLDDQGGSQVINGGGVLSINDAVFLNGTTGDATLLGSVVFEGATDDTFETTLSVVDPTADRAVVIPDVSGTVVTTGDTGTVTSTMISDGTIVDADINASAAIAQTKLSLDITDSEVNASAAIAGTKISPDFGSQNIELNYVDGSTGLRNKISWRTESPYLDESAYIAVNRTGVSGAPADLVFATGGAGTASERLRIDSSGRLGIGTSAPSAKLHVSSTAGVEALVSGGGTTGDTVLHLKGNGNAFKFLVPNAASQYGMGLYDVSNATYRMFVDSSGNVGIGTISPGANLEVSGSEAEIRLRDTRVDDAGYWGFKSELSNGERKLFIQDDGSDRVVIDASGNVGIGNTAPGAKLQIEGTSDQLKLTYSSIASYIHEVHSNGDYSIAKDSSERVRIDSSGRLLVGTSSARGGFDNNSVVKSDLQVEGVGSAAGANRTAVSIVNNGSADADSAGLYLARSGGTSVGSFTAVTANDVLARITFSGADGSEFVQAASIEGVIDGTPGSNDMPGRLEFHTTSDGASSPTERMRIASNGYIYMYEVYNNSVVGSYRDVYVESGGFVGYLSSVQAHKTNIQPIEDVAWLYSLSPVSFNRRKKDKEGNYTDEFYDQNEYGLIAEQVEPVAPQLCFYDIDEETEEETLAGVHYRQLITPMLKALQQANERIETLEAEVAALKTP